MSKIDEINKTVKEIAKDYGIPSKMIDEYIEGRTTLISTIPKPIMDTNKVKSLVESICCELGLNTAQDYDGIETDEDIIIYLNAINRKITLDKNNKLTKTSNNIMKLEHGQLAQDKITGFTGMVTGHSDYMTGCDQYLLQPPCKEKGVYPVAQWFDEGRLELIGNRMSKEDVKGDKNGADAQAMTK